MNVCFLYFNLNTNLIFYAVKVLLEKEKIHFILRLMKGLIKIFSGDTVSIMFYIL